MSQFITAADNLLRRIVENPEVVGRLPGLGNIDSLVLRETGKFLSRISEQFGRKAHSPENPATRTNGNPAIATVATVALATVTGAVAALGTISLIAASKS